MIKYKKFNINELLFLLFLHKRKYCGYSLEMSRQGGSKEYVQHTFEMGNKENNFGFLLKSDQR